MISRALVALALVLSACADPTPEPRPTKPPAPPASSAPADPNASPECLRRDELEAQRDAVMGGQTYGPTEWGLLLLDAEDACTAAGGSPSSWNATPVTPRPEVTQ